MYSIQHCQDVSYVCLQCQAVNKWGTEVKMRFSSYEAVCFCPTSKTNCTLLAALTSQAVCQYSPVTGGAPVMSVCLHGSPGVGRNEAELTPAEDETDKLIVSGDLPDVDPEGMSQTAQLCPSQALLLVLQLHIWGTWTLIVRMGLSFPHPCCGQGLH